MDLFFRFLSQSFGRPTYSFPTVTVLTEPFLSN